MREDIYNSELVRVCVQIDKEWSKRKSNLVALLQRVCPCGESVYQYAQSYGHWRRKYHRPWAGHDATHSGQKSAFFFLMLVENMWEIGTAYESREGSCLLCFNAGA